MITAHSMCPIKESGPGQEENLATKMVNLAARKCTEIFVMNLGAIMMSDALYSCPKQDSYVNSKVEEVIDP